MTTYRNIHGRSIQALSTDPTESVAEGQIWYNTGSETFKSIVSLEAWSSASSTVNTRGFIGSLGTQTANLGFGGYLATNTPTNVTEEYNGSGWTSGGNMTNGRYLPGGAGTQTTGLAFGGDERPPGSSNVNKTEEYNGTSWSPQNNMNVGRTSVGSAGTQTAGLAFGGPAPSGSDGESTEEYDGTSWTTANGLNAGRNSMVGIGIQTAAVGAGGYGPGYITNVEEYDGTNWTAVTALPVGQGGGCGAGTQTDGLLFGGFVPPAHTVTNRTLNYDGTSWTVSPATMGTARALGGNNNTGAPSSAALAGVGNSSPQYQLTEEYNKSANVITAGAWSSGNNMNSGRTGSAGFANKDDLVIAGGFISTPSPADDDSKALVEEYNGTSWSEVTNMPTKRTSASGCGASQTSGMVSGGIHTNQTTSVEYDGTNWTSGGAIPAVSRMAAHCGTVPAALRCGGAGNPGPALDQTIEYDSSSWTTANTMPHAEYGHMLVGTQTAAVFSGGHNAPTKNNLYEWDGTNWTTSPATLAVSINNNAGAAANGTQTAAMWMGGAPAVTASQVYDGTSVVTQPSLGAGRYSVNCGGGGTSTAAILGGGSGDTDATEEFTGETTALNVKTLTQS